MVEETKKISETDISSQIETIKKQLEKNNAKLEVEFMKWLLELTEVQPRVVTAEWIAEEDIPRKHCKNKF